MSLIEIVAVVFGVICVVLTVRRNIWCWPTGLVQVVLFIVIFYQAKLYSDLILHVVYVVMQFYGWHQWLHGSETRGVLPVSVLNKPSRVAWPLVVVGGTVGWGFVMAKYTDASVPYGDAFTTVASLVAQWLLAKKKLESWLFWIAVDVIAIGIYFYKELYLTSGLYAVFLVLATIGFFAWRQTLNDRFDSDHDSHVDVDDVNGEQLASSEVPA